MPTGGSGEGWAQDATIQAMIAKLGGSTPSGGSGVGWAQDASLQALLALIAGAGFISVLNLAALTAFDTSGLVRGQLAFVQQASEAPSYWALYPAGYAPPTGAVTVPAVGGGVWAYIAGGIAGEVQVYPLETGADDWAPLNAVTTAVAGNVPVRLMAGTWQARTIQPLPNGTTLRMSSTVKIVSFLAGLISPNTQTAPISAMVLQAGASLTMTADIIAGSDLIPVTATAGVVAGVTRVFILSSAATNTGAQYLITAINGDVLTVDRPILFPYAVATSTLQIIASQPTDITVEGGFATVTGTGAFLVAFSGALRVVIRQLVFDASGGVPSDEGGGLVLFDTGSLDSYFEQVYAYDVPTTNGGVFAGVERCQAQGVFQGLTQNGFLCNLSADCDLDLACNNNGAAGLSITDDNTKIRWTGTYNGNGGGGVVVDGDQIAGYDADIHYNLTGPGYSCSNAFSPCTNPTLTNCRLHVNATGVAIGTATGFRGVQVDAADNIGINLAVSATAVDTQFTSYDASSEFEPLDVLAASDTHPIIVETGDGAGNPAEHGLGAVGQTAAVNIAGVTGNTATNGTNLVATILSATTFSVPQAGNGAYTGGGTVLLLTGTGISVLADAQFYAGVERGNFGGGSAITVTGCHATFCGLDAELDTLVTGTFGTVTGAGRVDLQNARFDFEINTGAFIWTSDGTSSIYVGPNVKALGTTAGTEGAGFNSSGLVVIENSVDLSAVRAAFLEFGGGTYVRLAASPNVPFAMQWVNVSVASAVNVDLSVAQAAFPGLALTGALGGNISLIFAVQDADYGVDPAAFAPGIFTLTLQCGAAMVALPSATKLFHVRTTAAGGGTINAG